MGPYRIKKTINGVVVGGRKVDIQECVGVVCIEQLSRKRLTNRS